MSESSKAGSVKLVGGRPSLDFTNTVSDHLAGEPEEYLASYADLVTWAEHAGLLAADAAGRLRAAAARAPGEAQAALARAQALREALFRVFLALAQDDAPPADDLALVNEEAARAFSRRALEPAGAGLAWQWQEEDGALDRPLWPVVADATALLASAEIGRVKVCGADVCGWLFLDESRNRSRRWCSMEDCGNREKARRHYHRHQGEG
jgi:predicted RNA-binding Zn ribbon-like protein